MQNLKFKSYNYTQTEPEMVLEGKFSFNPEIPVSIKSRYGDGVWDWTNEDDRRLKVLNDSKIRFNWDAVTAGTKASMPGVKQSGQSFAPMLPPGIIEDIKRAAFLYASFSNLTGSSNNKPTGRKPISIVLFIKIIVNFFAYVYLQNLLADGNSLIKNLSHISLADIRRSIETYHYRTDEVRKALMKFCDEVIKKNLKNPPAWDKADLCNLSWKAEKPVESIAPLPDELFRLLSESSRSLVLNFLALLGETVCDQLPTGKFPAKPRWDRFPEMFESYIKRRQVTREKGTGWESLHTKMFVPEFGIKVETLRDFLMDVQCAAQTIILLYTGARYSEVASLRAGCLINRDGIYLLRSTITKGRRNLPLDKDEWIAIDIVRDAVRSLELISHCNFNKLLFANFDTVKAGQKENPLSLNGLTGRLNKYLRKIDTKENWVDWQLSTHQFRHGLVRQLAKADVGLPYITRQLHHYYTKLNEASYRSNETTLVYGMQKQRLVANATGLNAVKQAHREILHDMYGEGKIFAGGGAALHVERTKAFFTGLGVEGKEREKYIDKLAENGVAIVHTAVGWCTRNHVEPPSDEGELPPCLGDLECNPAACKNSVVPEGRKEDLIRQYRAAVNQSQAPEQSHLRKRWERLRDSYASMLTAFGIDPEDL